MKFAVIIPLYNKAPYVVETLQSIVNQTRWPDEVIVVDDVSTDDGPQVVTAFWKQLPEAFHSRVRTELVRLTVNGGISVARNAGFDRSTADVVTFLDADDLYAPDFFERMAHLFDREQADMVVLRVKLFPSGIAYPNFNPLKPFFEPLGNNAWLMKDPMRIVTSHQYVLGVGSNVVVRREWMLRERFLETIRFYEGIDCWYRHFRRIAAQDHTRIIQLQGDYLHVREVAGSASRSRFLHWTEPPYPPILDRYKRSPLQYDRHMMGLMRGRWMVHSVSNLTTFGQKLRFIWNHRKHCLQQVRYAFGRPLEMWLILRYRF